MKPKRIIIDAGPIVAFLNKPDQYHRWATEQFVKLHPPFYTCESVISEVCFLLRHSNSGVRNTMQLLERDLIQIPFRLEREISVVNSLMNKYKNVSMSLADACLVRMCEQITDSVICTLDSDFKVYRKAKRGIIPVIMPANV